MCQMSEIEPVLLAHSAPDSNSSPQNYSEHVENCREWASANAEKVAAYARSNSGWQQWLNSIRVAGEWHDLGKVDPENQAAFSSDRSARLKFDHIDAGVAHTLNNFQRDEAAAWLIRAHHAPGLPSAIIEHYRENHFLRGERHGSDDPDHHRVLIERNNGQLQKLVNGHLHSMNFPSVSPTTSYPIHGLATRIALSCLVDADHGDSARFDREGAGQFSATSDQDPRWSERLLKLTEYISARQEENKGEPERNQIRQHFFESCSDSELLSENLVSCEASVGLGKTTSVLAFLLRKAIKEDLRRIIIVAPFTNILRQTAKTLENAILLLGEHPDDVILQHHHKAEFSSQALRDLAVNWESPLILTTAVQFFETLGSNHPGALRKLHRLPGSAIFIDEAHASLPFDLWPQCFEWIRELSDFWSCPTALVSGSQIKFWEHTWGRPKGLEPIQLPEITPETVLKYSRKAEIIRCALKSESTPFTCSSLAERIEQNLETKRNQLVILNTVHSAAGLAKTLCNAFEESRTSLEHRRVLHLSTLLAPKHREDILVEIERRSKQGGSHPSWVLIATSCVEAGVDLDFHDGFREDSSVSSLIQTSGRVNRNGLFSNSELARIKLADDPAFRPHPQFRTSTRVLERLFPYLADGTEELTVVATRAAELEIEESPEKSRAYRLPRAEKDHDYPEVAQLCRVINSDTITVVICKDVVARLRKGLRVSSREILNNSIQIWGNKVTQLGLEQVGGRFAGELFFASYASYDPVFLGLGKGILDASSDKSVL